MNEQRFLISMHRANLAEGRMQSEGSIQSYRLCRLYGQSTTQALICWIGIWHDSVQPVRRSALNDEDEPLVSWGCGERHARHECSTERDAGTSNEAPSIKESIHDHLLSMA
tara:strand:+ start:5269 stop:5601 length:333 start_codon:yes stop_codon:yes gene_type:complete